MPMTNQNEESATIKTMQVQEDSDDDLQVSAFFEKKLEKSQPAGNYKTCFKYRVSMKISPRLRGDYLHQKERF